MDKHQLANAALTAAMGLSANGSPVFLEMSREAHRLGSVRNRHHPGQSATDAIAAASRATMRSGKVIGTVAAISMLALIAVASFFVPTAQAGAFCKNQYMFGTGRARSKSTAKKRGRRAWATKVTFKFGAGYRHWGRANSTQYGCNKKRWRWHCTAFAYPCRSYSRG